MNLADSKQHYPAIKTPPPESSRLGSALWQYSSLAVENCQGWILLMLRASAHCTVWQSNTDVLNLSKDPSTWNNYKNQPSASTLQVSASKQSQHREHVGPLSLALTLFVVSPKDARGHYWWVHQRMRGVNIEDARGHYCAPWHPSPKDARGHYWWVHQRMRGVNIEHQPLALYQFDIVVRLRENSQLHDKLLSSLISAFCTVADFEFITSTTQPNWTNFNVDTVDVLKK